MKIIDEFLDKIMPVVIGNNNPENIRLWLKPLLTKLYDEGFYQGTMNVIKEVEDE